MIIKTAAADETFALGARLAKLLAPGDVICLAGDLGTGKTVLVQGIAAGLGIDEAVTSPTFTVLNVYEGVIPLYHFDLYRLDKPAELEDVGFYDYIGGGGVTVVEWPDKFIFALPGERLWISLLSGEQPTERILEFIGTGQRYTKLGEEMLRIAVNGS